MRGWVSSPFPVRSKHGKIEGGKGLWIALRNGHRIAQRGAQRPVCKARCLREAECRRTLSGDVAAAIVSRHLLLNVPHLEANFTKVEAIAKPTQTRLARGVSPIVHFGRAVAPRPPHNARVLQLPKVGRREDAD